MENKLFIFYDFLCSVWLDMGNMRLSYNLERATDFPLHAASLKWEDLLRLNDNMVMEIYDVFLFYSSFMEGKEVMFISRLPTFQIKMIQ